MWVYTMHCHVRPGYSQLHKMMICLLTRWHAISDGWPVEHLLLVVVPPHSKYLQMMWKIQYSVLVESINLVFEQIVCKKFHLNWANTFHQIFQCTSRKTKQNMETYDIIQREGGGEGVPSLMSTALCWQAPSVCLLVIWWHRLYSGCPI